MTSLFSAGSAPDTDAIRSKADRRAARTARTLLESIPPGAKFILVDENFLPVDELATTREILHFDTAWAGPLPEASIISQWERFRRLGSQFIAFAWPALWWLEHYQELSNRIVAACEGLRVEDGLVLFDLRPGVRAQREQQFAAQQKELDTLRENLRKLSSLPRPVAAEPNKPPAAPAISIPPAAPAPTADARALADLKKKLTAESERLTNAATHLQWQLRVTGYLLRNLPRTAVLLVVSQGDPELLTLGFAPGWHFPQMPDGSHAGAPLDSDDAMAQLTRLQAAGGTHFFLPSWTAWWLEYYSDFANCLARHHRRLHQDSDFILYELCPQRCGPVSTP